MSEKLPGTRDVARRIVNAENGFVELVKDYGFTEEEAYKILSVYVKARAVKLDAVGGVYRFTHGAFVDAGAMRNALKMEVQA